MFFGSALMVFIIAADEQSVISSGVSAPDRIRLQDLVARGSGNNKHIALSDFYFGRQYIYATKLVQFEEVYVPIFPEGQPENGANLRILVWIRNDRNSNQRLIQNERDLDQFVADFNRHPQSVSGILRQPTGRVRQLAADAYPGASAGSLQVLWARHYPEAQFVNLLWALLGVLVAAASLSAVAYRRASRAV